MADGAPASVWLVDKAAGPTSHDIVATVRRQLGSGVRVGHAGTLDPFATGLLVVLVGRTTRLARFLVGLDKTYEADLRLGASSATGDPEGPVVQVGPPPTREALLAALDTFRGEQEQAVPALAAVKVAGERLYRRTRRGEAVEEVPTRPVTIDELELVSGPDPEGFARVRARVSSGTYIRQLAMDIGAELGCGAYCAGLRRTRVGPHLRVEDAVRPEEVATEGGLAAAAALAHLPQRHLTELEAQHVAHGRSLTCEQDCEAMALVQGASLRAVARCRDRRLKPMVVMA